MIAGEQSGRSAGDASASPATATVPVWDIFVRMFHWSLVATFAIAFISAEEWDWLHEWVGYGAAGLVSLRILWGIVGTKYARFSQFVRGPIAVSRYLADMVQGRERRYLGHNPAGAAMILALLAGVVSLGVTGYMLTTDAYWGVEWVEEVHELAANGMLVLIGLHIGGVILASVRHGENLVAAMLTGRKRA